MNKKYYLFYILVCVTISLFFLPACGKKDKTGEMAGQSEQANVVIEKIAELKYFHGKVKIKEVEDSKWQPANINFSISNTGQIKTYNKAIAIVQFENGDNLRINENTLLSIKTTTKLSKKLINLKLSRGNIFMKIKKVTRYTSVTVETPTAVADFRGREFFTQVKKSKQSIIGVYHGKMAVTGAEKTVYVNTGFGTIVKKGKTPLTPFRLPEKPVVEKIR